jgi:hypothetical protein
MSTKYLLRSGVVMITPGNSPQSYIILQLQKLKLNEQVQTKNICELYNSVT